MLDGQEGAGQGEVRPFPVAKALSDAPNLGLLSQHWGTVLGLSPLFNIFLTCCHETQTFSVLHTKEGPRLTQGPTVYKVPALTFEPYILKFPFTLP